MNVVEPGIAQVEPAVIWPEHYAPQNTAVHVRNEIFVAAPPGTVWAWLVRAPLWPDWYGNSHDVVGLDPEGRHDLRAGSRFRWKTFGVRVESRVLEYVPARRLAWDARGIGLDAWHAWVLTPRGEGCHVLTEESQHGWGAWLVNFLMPRRMWRGHDLWLRSLRDQATRGLPPPL